MIADTISWATTNIATKTSGVFAATPKDPKYGEYGTKYGEYGFDMARDLDGTQGLQVYPQLLKFMFRKIHKSF